MIPFNLEECLASGIAITGCPGSGKTTLLKHIIHNLIENGITVYVLDVSKAWNENTPINNIIEVENKDLSFRSISTVFDISKLSYRIKQQWVNQFVRMIYDAHVAGFDHKEFIVFEECHTYIPTGAMRTTERYEPMINLITVGRNFNLRYALATQFPAMADANLFKSPQQRYFGWTTEFNDVSRIRSYFPRENKNHLEKQLRELGKMQFLYQYGNTISPFRIEPYKQLEQPQEAIKPNSTFSKAPTQSEGFSLTVTFGNQQIEP
jgi:hypothetical protein